MAVLALAIALHWLFPSLSPALAVLLSSGLLLTFENYTVEREPSDSWTSHACLPFVPILRETYVSWLLIMTRSPGSCVYANPFEDE